MAGGDANRAEAAAVRRPGEVDRELWPSARDRLSAMDAWAQRAHPLVQRLGAHDCALAELAAESYGREGQAELLWRRHQLEELMRVGGSLPIVSMWPA